MNKTFYKIMVAIIKPIAKFFYPTEIRGAQNLEKLSGGYIICSNHLSNLDPILLMIHHKRPIHFMAKEELFKNRILKCIFSGMGAFAVKRGKGDNSALIKSENIIKDKEVLGIFIEGTRSKTGEFLRPKSGAILISKNTNSVILPVCITGTARNNKIKIFHKTIISYGEPILQSDFRFIDNSRIELKNATELVMNRIKNQRD